MYTKIVGFSRSILGINSGSDCRLGHSFWTATSGNTKANQANRSNSKAKVSTDCRPKLCSIGLRSVNKIFSYTFIFLHKNRWCFISFHCISFWSKFKIFSGSICFLLLLFLACLNRCCSFHSSDLQPERLKTQSFYSCLSILSYSFFLSFYLVDKLENGPSKSSRKESKLLVNKQKVMRKLREWRKQNKYKQNKQKKQVFGSCRNDVLVRSTVK